MSAASLTKGADSHRPSMVRSSHFLGLPGPPKQSVQAALLLAKVSPQTRHTHRGFSLDNQPEFAHGALQGGYSNNNYKISGEMVISFISPCELGLSRAPCLPDFPTPPRKRKAPSLTRAVILRVRTPTYEFGKTQFKP